MIKEVYISMKNKIQLIVIVILFLSAYQSYAQAAFPEITVNLTFPQFQRLKMDGGYVYLDGGMKGIILYHVNETNYVAFDRVCPHDLNSNCEVQVDGSSLFFIDHCCKSTFNVSDGQPTRGPAQRALIQYRIETSENKLIVSDEVIN